MLLKDIVDRGLYLFADKADSWEEAIRMSCKPLADSGIVDEGYAQEIIDCVNEHGPYIVLLPDFALPHSTQNSSSATGTAISFMKVQQPVEFEPGNPEKNARVFFTLAAVDKTEHLRNMKMLFKMLTNASLLEELLQISSAQELLVLDEKYF